MPSETLRLRYGRNYRPNRRRPKHPILHAVTRLILGIVVLIILIGILIKLGVIQSPENEISVAASLEPTAIS